MAGLDPTLAVSALMSLGVAAVFFQAGRRLSSRRRLSGERWTAWRMFTVWWYGMGAVAAMHGARMLPVAFGIHDLAFTLLAGLCLVAALGVAYAGLMSYLSYLFLGDRRVFGPIAGIYAIYVLVMWYVTLRTIPTGVVANGWGIDVTLAAAPAIGTVGDFLLSAASVVLIVFPPLVMIGAFVALQTRLRSKAARRRMMVVAGSLAVSVVAAVLAIMDALEGIAAVQIGARLLAAGSAAAVMTIYAPPRWLRRRWDLGRVLGDAPGVDAPVPEP